MELLINYGSFLGFMLLSYGVYSQIRKTLKRKSVKDIQGRDIVARISACLLLLTKFYNENDPYLIAGQVTMISLLLFYGLIYIHIKHGNKIKDLLTPNKED